MGRTRGKYTGKLIYIEPSGLQKVGGQWLQNVNGELVWNGLPIATIPLSVSADQVTYDNSTSGLTATDVQAAIDEIENIIDNLSSAASDITYDNGTSGLTATNVQDAIDELENEIDNIVQEATTASNGLTEVGNDIKLGTATSTFMGYISGTTLTITSQPSAPITPGQVIISVGTATGAITANTIINGFVPGTSGGIGTYTLSQSQSIADAITPVTMVTSIPVTESTTISGTSTYPLRLAGQIELKPASATNTSQNKSVRLANTTGAISLVEEVIFAYKEIYYSSTSSIVIPVANGLLYHDLNASSATFTATISGTTLTSSGVAGTIKVGQTVSGGTVAPNTIITAQLTGTTGSDGTYSVSVSQTVTSTAGITSTLTSTPTNLNVLSNVNVLTRVNVSSSVAISSANDFSSYYNFYSTNYPTTNIHAYPYEITLKLTVNSDIDVSLVPFSHNGYANPNSAINAGTGGGPQYISGIGYTNPTICPAGVNTLVSLTYNYQASDFYNLGNIAFYRNKTTIPANDALAATITIHAASMSLKQLYKP
jgi:hypothetical protein